MLKPGDKVKFVNKNKFIENFKIKLDGLFPNETDLKFQKELQGNIVTVKDIDQSGDFFYTDDTQSKYYFVGRVKKINTLELEDCLFEI